ncbi:MAG: helix-turn-helix transcriptional regulator [Clostridia bacterium]|nr:helix-turn-helix transcriptional regulator [Clostridia bacterium]
MRLKDLREDSDIKQKTIADFLHIKQNTYSQYENCQRQLPIDILIQLADFYNVSTDYILGITDVKTPYPKRAQRKNDS